MINPGNNPKLQFCLCATFFVHLQSFLMLWLFLVLIGACLSALNRSLLNTCIFFRAAFMSLQLCLNNDIQSLFCNYNYQIDMLFNFFFLNLLCFYLNIFILRRLIDFKTWRRSWRFGDFAAFGRFVLKDASCVKANFPSHIKANFHLLNKNKLNKYWNISFLSFLRSSSDPYFG